MFTIRTSARKTLIIILLSIALIMLLLSALTMFMPGYELSKQTVLSAHCVEKIEYKAHLNENPIFNVETLDHQKYYISPFTNYFEIDCNIDISTQVKSNIECTTEVYALLISEISVEGELYKVWEKRYDYSIPKTQTITGDSLSINRHMYISLDKYKDLVTTLHDEYSMMTKYYLRLVFESNVVVSNKGLYKGETILSYLDIPFTDTVMKVTEATPVTKDILIQQDGKTQKQPNSSLAFLFFALFLGSVCSFLVVLLKTKGVEKLDQFTTDVSKIFKEYGNRLAGLSDTLAYQASTMISIDKISDIIKIADEIGQTVFYYEVDSADERKVEFYVFDEGRIYYLVIFGDL